MVGRKLKHMQCSGTKTRFAFRGAPTRVNTGPHAVSLNIGVPFILTPPQGSLEERTAEIKLCRKTAHENLNVYPTYRKPSTWSLNGRKPENRGPWLTTLELFLGQIVAGTSRIGDLSLP